MRVVPREKNVIPSRKLDSGAGFLRPGEKQRKPSHAQKDLRTRERSENLLVPGMRGTFAEL